MASKSFGPPIRRKPGMSDEEFRQAMRDDLDQIINETNKMNGMTSFALAVTLFAIIAITVMTLT